MSNIQINTHARWVDTNVYNLKEPLYLSLEIKNGSYRKIEISRIGISIKKKFWFSKDIFHSDQSYLVDPNDTLNVTLDVTHIATEYSFEKRFAVKVFTDQDVIQSKPLTLKSNH